MIRTRHSTHSKSSLVGWGGALVLAAALAVPDAALAEGDTEEAKLHFARAETAYKLGKFAEAIRGYEAAYRAMPAPAFLFNIAQSYRQQYGLDKNPVNLQKALALYRSYLRESKEPPNRETVRKLIGELEAMLAQVQQESERQRRPGKLVLAPGANAAGAAVRIDGKVAGALPLSRSVTSGGHFVQVDKHGFRPWSATVSVAAEAEVRLDVALTAEAAGTRADEPRPFYKRWWFWTAVGVAAVAGATTAVYFATRDDTPAGVAPIDLR